MTTYQKKICLIGDFAVGKTSLVNRYVNQVFSEDYLTTVGVSIVTKNVQIETDVNVKMVIWDIAGADHLTTVSRSYLSGANGYLLIADGTRPETLKSAIELKNAVDRNLGNPPAIQLINKYDLKEDWSVDSELLTQSGGQSQWKFTSALSGVGVEEAFVELARRFFGDAK